jgi:hypothetical protein
MSTLEFLFKSPTLQTSAIERISSSSSSSSFPSLSQICYASLFDPQSFLSHTYTNLSLSCLSCLSCLSLFVREVVDKDAIKLGCCVGMNANEEEEMGVK